MALTFGGPSPDRAELARWLSARRDMAAVIAADLKAERQRLTEKGYLDPFAAAVMYRSQLHAETDLRWHDEFGKILAELPEEAMEATDPREQQDTRTRVSGTPVGPPRQPPTPPASDSP